MKKKLLCAVLAFMLVILCGCSDNYFSPVRFLFDQNYAQKLVSAFIEELASEYEYMMTPTIELEIGDRQSVIDGFYEKVAENYTIDVDRHSYVYLYRFSGGQKYVGLEVLKGHFVYANYNDKAIAFCEETASGSHYLLSYEFETGDVLYYKSSEELYAAFDFDESKWFKCCNLYDEIPYYEDFSW